jgi:hypothetical protein
VLLELDAVWIVLLVLVGVIVATLAFLTSEGNQLTHSALPFRLRRVRIPTVRREGNAGSRRPAQGIRRAGQDVEV